MPLQSSMNSSTAAGLEEGLQECNRLICKYASKAYKAVIEAGIIMDVVQALAGSSFGIIGAPDHSAKSSIDHGASAHGTWFKRDCHGAVV